MALDAATTEFLAKMAESGQPPLHQMEPAQARELTAMLKEMYGPGPDMKRAESRTMSIPGRDISVRMLVPDEAPRALMVYYHGGGWVIGALDEFETLGRQLAERTGCAVALVDYRLAPEHRYPAAVDDAWDALLWINDRIEEIAGARVPLIVAGDSAGGNLATIVSRRARIEGPMISQQVLVYPVTACDFDTPSYVAPENQLMLSRDTMVWFFDHYVSDTDRTNPDVSPLHAKDLRGLPPAVVVTAEHDVLRDEGEAYAAALESAGVPVTHRRFQGQMHGFFTMVNVLPGSADAIDFISTEIGRHLDRVC